MQGPGKILSGDFVRVWSPMFDRDGLGWKPCSKGLPRRPGDRRGAGVLSLAEQRRADMIVLDGEERQRQRLLGLRDDVGTGINTSQYVRVEVRGKLLPAQRVSG